MSYIDCEGQDVENKFHLICTKAEKWDEVLQPYCFAPQLTACMQVDIHLTLWEKKTRPHTCSNIPGQQNNLTTNPPWRKLQSLNLSLSLCAGHTCNSSELVTLLLILHMVQGIFNQQTCKWRIIFQACVVTGWWWREQISCFAST